MLQLCRREKTLTLFYEVIVRVARKVEPSRQKYIFPLPDLDNQGESSKERSCHAKGRKEGSLMMMLFEWVAGYGDTPVTLFEKCLQSRKLHTAILYLPLIDQHSGSLNLISPSPGRSRMSSTSSNAGYASAVDDLPDLQLVLALSLRLLWECLRRGNKEWRMVGTSPSSPYLAIYIDIYTFMRSKFDALFLCHSITPRLLVVIDS